MKLRLIFFIFLILTGCNLTYNRQETVPSQRDTIIVIYAQNQTNISTSEKAVPVLQVLSACGINMEWEGNDSASFEVDGQKFFISIPAIKICAENSSYNCIQIPPGTANGFCYAKGNEIYVDIATMKGILFELKIDADLYISSE